MDTTPQKTELSIKICELTNATFPKHELSNLIEKVRSSFEKKDEIMTHITISMERSLGSHPNINSNYDIQIITENTTKKTILGNLECYIFYTSLFYCEPNFDKRESSIIRIVTDKVERIKRVLGINQ